MKVSLYDEIGLTFSACTLLESFELILTLVQLPRCSSLCVTMPVLRYGRVA